LDWAYKYTNTKGITKTNSGSMTSGIGGWNVYGVELRWKTTDLASASVTVFVSPTTSAVITPTTTTAQAAEEKPPGVSTGDKQVQALVLHWELSWLFRGLDFRFVVG
jgi:hypothetical protein